MAGDSRERVSSRVLGTSAELGAELAAGSVVSELGSVPMGTSVSLGGSEASEPLDPVGASLLLDLERFLA